MANTNANVSGMPFVSHLQKGIFVRTFVDLAEPVNIKLLSLAWRMVLIACPYYEQTLVMRDGELEFASHHCRCEVLPILSDEEVAGSPLRTPSFGGDLVFVQAEGSRIVTGVSHALTDGYGLSQFMWLLLYHYFCLVDNVEYKDPFRRNSTGRVAYDGDADALADLQARDLPKPHAYDEVGPCLSLPSSDAQTRHVVEVDARDYERICNDLTQNVRQHEWPLVLVGGLKCAVAFVLLASVVSRLQPENELPISSRSPVNTRQLLERPDALRNFSLPQACMSIDPRVARRLWQGDPGIEVRQTENVVRQLASQLTPECICWQLSNIREFAQGRRPDPLLGSLYRRTMLVSNVGKSYYEPQTNRVIRCGPMYGSYPLAVYLAAYGNTQSFFVFQEDPSTDYAGGLARLLTQLGAKVELKK